MTQHDPRQDTLRQPPPAGALPPLPPKMGTLTFLWKLFLCPREAILNARIHRTWLRCALIILVAAALAAAVRAVQEQPAISRLLRTAQQLLAGELGALRYTPATRQLSWGRDGGKPRAHTASRDGFRLDTAASALDLRRQQLAEASEDCGLFLAQDAFICWKRLSPGSSQIYLFDLHGQRVLEDVFRQYGQPEEGALVLSEETLATLFGAVAPFVLVFCIVQNLSEYLYILVSCVIIFMLMSFFFRGADRAPLTAVLASNVACLIPPFLITLALAVTPLIRVTTDNISTCFTIFFVIYLVIILLDRSVDVRLALPGRRPPQDN